MSKRLSGYTRIGQRKLTESITITFFVKGDDIKLRMKGKNLSCIYPGNYSTPNNKEQYTTFMNSTRDAIRNDMGKTTF